MTEHEDKIRQVARGRKIISVVIECDGKRFRVIDNLRDLVGGEWDRAISEARVGRKVIDLARFLEVA